MSKRLLTIVTGLIVLANTPTLHAENITYYFGGKLTSVFAVDPAPLPFSPSSLFRGSFVFDSMAAKINAIDFEAPPFSLTINGVEFSGIGPGHSTTVVSPSYIVLNPFVSSGPTFGRTAFEGFEVFLGSSTANFVAGSLPVNLDGLDLDLVHSMHLYSLSGPPAEVMGNIEYLSRIDPNLSPVPEPAERALFVIGLAVIALNTRRIRRHGQAGLAGASRTSLSMST